MSEEFQLADEEFLEIVRTYTKRPKAFKCLACKKRFLQYKQAETHVKEVEHKLYPEDWIIEERSDIEYD